MPVQLLRKRREQSDKWFSLMKQKSPWLVNTPVRLYVPHILTLLRDNPNPDVICGVPSPTGIVKSMSTSEPTTAQISYSPRPDPRLDELVMIPLKGLSSVPSPAVAVIGPTSASIGIDKRGTAIISITMATARIPREASCPPPEVPSQRLTHRRSPHRRSGWKGTPNRVRH